MQVLAVEDIGHLVAAVFAAPARFAGKTFEIASDSVTGRQLEGLFSAAAGRPIPYSLFSAATAAFSSFTASIFFNLFFTSFISAIFIPPVIFIFFYANTYSASRMAMEIPATSASSPIASAFLILRIPTLEKYRVIT